MRRVVGEDLFLFAGTVLLSPQGMAGPAFLAPAVVVVVGGPAAMPHFKAADGNHGTVASSHEYH